VRNARGHLQEIAPALDTLHCRIESPRAINGALSLDGIGVSPLLRSAAAEKELRFPAKVRDYFEAMMAGIGYQALPAI
jgi:glutaredoxin 2